MVAKLSNSERATYICLNLAKIHMVAKRRECWDYGYSGLNLAKIHMVAKPPNQ